MAKAGEGRKKVLLLPFAVLGLLLGGCRQLSTEAETEGGLQENQRIGKITVTSIVGNELTYYEETEAETEDVMTETEPGTEPGMEAEPGISTEEGTEAAEDAENKTNSAVSDSVAGKAVETMSAGQQKPDMSQMGSEGMPDMSQMGNGEMPDMSQFGSGEMPDMSRFGSGEMPDMSRFGSGEMPDMSQFGSGEMPDMSQFGSGEMPDMPQFGGGSQIEIKTVYLPVGVVVHTDKGHKTFSILEEGDELEVLFEENESGEEIITEIWMEGSSK